MTQVIRLVAAMDQNGGVGFQNKLPWPHQAQDMQNFRRITYGTPIIMGRETFDSLPGVLKNRPHYVLTYKARAPEVVNGVPVVFSSILSRKCSTGFNMNPC